jgi:hypothetical protein
LGFRGTGKPVPLSRTACFGSRLQQPSSAAGFGSRLWQQARGYLTTDWKRGDVSKEANSLSDEA